VKLDNKKSGKKKQKSSGEDLMGVKAKKNKKPSDSSWESAVAIARGLPDGQSTEGPTDMDTDAAPPVKAKNQAKSNKVIGKIKKFTNKKQVQNRGFKRKHDGGDNDSGNAKKGKFDDLSTKERKKQRKMQKDNYEIAHRSKKLWEQLRRHDLSVEKKQEICGELHQLVKGSAKELIFAHDTSRVFQCLMKYGLQEHRDELFEELQEHILEMTQSKYAKFFVRKLLKYGTKAQKSYVFRCLYGNVRKLIRHKEAAEIVEIAYNDFANANQRSSLIEEFYGPSYALFKTVEARTLGDIIQSSPEKRDSILSNMKDALAVLMDKEICRYSIVHKVLLEYFVHAPEKPRAEMIESVRESLIHMLHTRDGANVAMKCIWLGTAKDRKVIIKSMKTFLKKICYEDYGHLVLLAIFDAVDDTRLVQKAIIEEMMKHLSDLISDTHARKVLFYLLSPRDPLYFCPDITSILQRGDTNPTSKKDMSVRRAELLNVVSPYLLTYVQKNCRTMVTQNAHTLLLLAVLNNASGDVQPAMKAVCDIAAEPFVAGSLDNFHMVEHTAGHLALKRIIMDDKQRRASNKVLFSQVLVDTLPSGSLKSWAACNRGCFVLDSLISSNEGELRNRILTELSGLRSSLQHMEFKGAQILLNKLPE